MKQVVRLTKENIRFPGHSDSDLTSLVPGDVTVVPHSSNKYFLSTYCVPDIALGAGAIPVNKTKPLPSWGLCSSGERWTNRIYI